MPAYIIALRPKELAVAKPISLLSSVASLTVVTANNGSESELGLPLYIRYVLSHGRSEHSQIGNRAALGCLRSHMDVWARVVRSGVPSIVLEEDILVSSDSDFKLARFLEYFGPSGPAWDILMLDPGHLNTGGQWGPVGPYAANCTDPNGCTWFGTRAYAIRPAGAALLLSQADPPLVQVDALVSLVSNYFAPASGNGTAQASGRTANGTFRMIWAREAIFGMQLLRRSTIFDWCIKCYLPTEGYIYLLAVVTSAFMFVVLIRQRSA